MLTRKRISDLAKGRTLYKETRIKISDALKGRILSKDTKIKIKNYKHTLLFYPFLSCLKEAKKEGRQRQASLKSHPFSPQFFAFRGGEKK